MKNCPNCSAPFEPCWYCGNTDIYWHNINDGGEK